MPPTRKSTRRTSTRRKPSHRNAKPPANPLCVACTGLTGHGEAGFLTQETEAIPAPWLQAIHRQAVPVHTHRFHNLADQGFPDATPVQSDIRIRFTRRTPALPQRVLYWGAGHCAVTCAGALQGAERAYGVYDNMGIATRKGHTLEFVMQTPRPYIARQRGVTKAQQWCRHVHFVDLKAVEGCVGMGDGHDAAATTEASANCATGRCSSTRGRRRGSRAKATSRNRKPAGGHHEGRAVTGKCPPANNVLYTVAAFPRTKPLKLEGGSYTCTPLFHPEQPSGQAYHHSVFIGFEQYLMAKAKGILGINAIQHADWPPIHDTDMVVNGHATPDAIAQQLERAKVKREQPLIVYCANEGCEAAQELLYKLTQIGYCNTYYLKHGMEEARAKLAGVGRFLGCGKGRGGGGNANVRVGAHRV